jgi:hypothetical protein
MDVPLENLLDLIHLGQDKKFISQVLMPFSEAGADHCVALLSGNLRICDGLKKDGCKVSPQEAMCDLEQNRLMSCVPEVSDELERVVLDEAAAYKEADIKEEWSKADEAFVSSRSSRMARQEPLLSRAAFTTRALALPADIEAMLAAAELEEKSVSDGGAGVGTESRITSIRKEAHDELKDRAKDKKPALRQIKVPGNSLVGDVVERSTERSELSMQPLRDETSAKVILNDIKTQDLKQSSRFKLGRKTGAEDMNKYQ